MDYEKFKSLKIFKKNFFNFLKILILFKPGIIIGNSLSFLTGFFLASQGKIQFFLLKNSWLSIICIIASACVLNNIFDRDIDQKMNRTKNRILCHENLFLIFFSYLISIILFIFSFWFSYKSYLIKYFILSFLSFIIYVFLYTKFLKRNTIYATIIGGISGAFPPVIGYLTVHKTINFCCIYLFLLFFFWQIPHTFSIAVYRLKDYKKIKLPLYPLKKGVLKSQIIMSFCIILNILFLFKIFENSLLNFNNFLIIFFFYSLWLFFSIFGRLIYSIKKWSYYMFLYSLIVLIIQSFFLIDFFHCKIIYL
ncbi:protoheme IX farnesyltransferase [Buchnera aphidicola]|uniref:Protoheme IX farnesyltransferase n=1 Tax=Buchnera aphidicola subsp. Tuberolachnus salignus TaxID=98804 RepID=A0A160SYE3_BUCTT|nr:protoheme IX farnesyltransferase [Buchnera aphidicola]CUR53274.1 Protoheme IX farnesyltransferase [Buchnera aphidicola (Tuberolachnus salignus)]